MYRRDFIQGMVSLPFVSKSQLTSDKTISLVNSHTNEKFVGEVIPQNYAEINYLLRDFRANQSIEMDPQVLELLSTISQKTGLKNPLITIVSGYRSPQTNAMLRNRSSKVAKHSLHMQGKAVDLRIPQIPLTKLRNIAMDLKAGGVGYYSSSNFVHVDTGNIRYW